MRAREAAQPYSPCEKQLEALRAVLAISKKQTDLLAKGDSAGFCESVAARENALRDAICAHEERARAEAESGRVDSSEKAAISDMISEIMRIDAANAGAAQKLLESYRHEAGKLRATRQRTSAAYQPGAAYGGVYFDSRK